MIPTVIGAFIGMSINFAFMAEHPIMGALLMFGAMVGMLFAVTALRVSAPIVRWTRLNRCAIG